MSRNSSHHHLSSLTLDENLHQQQQQKWLLTYLDVFILIIMLVITLIAVNDFKTENKQTQTQNLDKKTITHISKLENKNIPKEPQKKQLSAQSARIKQVAQLTKAPSALEAKKSETITKTKPQPIAPDKKNTENTQKVIQKQEPEKTQSRDDILQQKLKRTISSLGLIDRVDMKIKEGYAQLEIQDNILFKSSEAKLLDAGKDLLSKLTTLLSQSSGLIYIEGHTDNRPINTAQFPSNWELGAARATSVLHFLASQNLDASRLRAVTYGDTKPIANNDTAEGQQKNRRVSLVIKVSDKID